LEIGERIVFNSVKLDDLARVEGRGLCRPEGVEEGEIREVGKVPVAVVDIVGAAERETFLIRLPSLAGRD